MLRKIKQIGRTYSRKRVLRKSSRDFFSWFAKAKWDARGATTKVYDKVKSTYPRKYLLNHGNLVKVICKSSRRESKIVFWEMKLIHALFPEYTLLPRAVRYNDTLGRGLAEIHVNEVPVHKELASYMGALQRKQSFGHDRELKEYKACEDAQSEWGEFAHKVSSKMAEAGIRSAIDENPTNVSLANPHKPIFFEPYLIGIEGIRGAVTKEELMHLFQSKRKQLLEYIESPRFSPEKRQQLLSYVSNWEKWVLAKEPLKVSVPRGINTFVDELQRGQ